MPYFTLESHKSFRTFNFHTLLERMRSTRESMHAKCAGHQAKQLVWRDYFAEHAFTERQVSAGSPLLIVGTPMIEHHEHGQMTRSQFTQ